VPAFVVFNAAPPSATTLVEDAKAIVDAAGLAVAPTVLRERSAYRAAWPLGRAVIENEPYGKAAQEISELQDWVCAQLKMCTPDTLKAKRKVAHG
jgi:chromosome partitioning protein